MIRQKKTRQIRDADKRDAFRDAGHRTSDRGPRTIFSLFLLPAIFVALLAFIPLNIPKYIISESDFYANIKEAEQHMVAHDLDSDGVSEIIMFKMNKIGSASFVVYNQAMTPKPQTDLSGDYNNNWDFFLIGDADNDLKAEIYTITLLENKLILNINDPFDIDSPINQSLIIDTYSEGFDRNSLAVKIWEENDLDGDGYKEIIFTINAGHTIIPRKLYVYFPSINVIRDFSYEHSVLHYSSSADINGDGIKEIFIKTSAPGNSLILDGDTIVDKYTRALYIDLVKTESMQVLDERISVTGNMITFSDICGKDTLIMSLANIQGYPGPELYRWTNHQVFIDSSNYWESDTINSWFYGRILIDEKGIRSFYNLKGKLFKIHPCRGIIETNKSVARLGQTTYLPLINDSTTQLIGKLGTTKLMVYSPDFKHASEIKLIENLRSSDLFHISMLKNKTSKEILLQNGNEARSYTYKINLTYYAIYPGLLLVYGFIILFIYLIRRQQRKQWEKERNKEQRINQLQFQAISNQINPHFSFNLLNSIGHSILEGDRNVAYDILAKYSQLTRDLIENSRKIVVSLDRELEFTKRYLELQKTRLDGNLDFDFFIHPEVNTNWKIPKMIIHTFAENAIKHGLMPKEKDRHISITAKMQDTALHISIEDNGIGRKSAGELKKPSTKQGLQIISQIINLYRDVYSKSISYSISNANPGEPVGTLVELVVEV